MTAGKPEKPGAVGPNPDPQTADWDLELSRLNRVRRLIDELDVDDLGRRLEIAEEPGPVMEVGCGKLKECGTFL
jgi:hypothetical protein